MKRSFFALLALCACGPSAPVTFSELRVEELAATRAVIRFTTSLPTSCEIELGSSAEILDQHFTDPDMEPGQLVTQHQVPLENLVPGQRYFFRARAVDAANRVFFSAPSQLETPNAVLSTLSNVALKSRGTSVVSVSSNWGGGDDDSTFGANKAIDGDFVSEWSSNGDGDAARVELDLGQVRRLMAFGFRSRSMTDGSAIIRKVGLALDGAAELVFDTPDPAQLYVFDLPAPVDARRAVVRAHVTTSGNTGAKEIQLLSP